MLNVRTYLPSLEDHGSLPETLTSDITIDGENSYIAGIPEELIQPAENSEQSNEDDGVINDDNAAMNEAKEEKEELEQDGSEETEENQGDSTEDNQSEVEESKEDEESPDEEGDTDTKKLRDEEEEITDVQYAIESYQSLIENAGSDLTYQSASFLQVGLHRINKRLDIQAVANEDYSFSGMEGHRPADSARFVENLRKALTTVNELLAKHKA